MTRRLLVAVVGIVVGIAAAGEHLARRGIERRYHQALDSRRQLEREFATVLATRERLVNELEEAKRSVQGLSQALEDKSARLDEVQAHLTEERRTVQELQAQLVTVQQQMDQVQGELFLVLAERSESTDRARSSLVELERVVVSEMGTLGLQGRVVSVHRDWNFVIVNLGWDQVKIGDTVSILRHDQLLAKGRVERVQEHVSAISLSEEWARAEIQVNDVVRPL